VRKLMLNQHSTVVENLDTLLTLIDSATSSTIATPMAENSRNYAISLSTEININHSHKTINNLFVCSDSLAPKLLLSTNKQGVAKRMHLVLSTFPNKTVSAIQYR